MTFDKYIKRVLDKKFDSDKITYTHISKKLGMSPQGLSQKIKRMNYQINFLSELLPLINLDLIEEMIKHQKTK